MLQCTKHLLIQRQARTEKDKSEFIPIRNLNYHVLVWGESSARRAATTLGADARLDGRGGVLPVHGGRAERGVFCQAPHHRRRLAWLWQNDGRATDNYWFPDYLADLDFLLDHYAPNQPVDLVGHSMGGNVVMMYAGSRPGRVRRLVNLEGFGMPENRPSQAPGRYAKWMDELKSLQRGEMELKAYDTSAGVARRLMKTNPRLARDEAGIAKANWLATHWAAENAAGQWEILGDPAHKIINANLSNLAEALELYKCITAPVLAVEASDDSMSTWWKGKYSLDQYHERLKSVPNCTVAVIDDAGHMLHHDQPEELAGMLEAFVSS